MTPPTKIDSGAKTQNLNIQCPWRDALWAYITTDIADSISVDK